MIDEGVSDSITPSKRFQYQRQSLRNGSITPMSLKESGNLRRPSLERSNAFKESNIELPNGRDSLKRPAQRSRSEGYGGNIHMHTAAAISHATKSSMQKSTRRISWGISRKNGINISLEDLRRRSTKIVVMGYENVGKTAFVVRFVTRRFISEYSSDKHQFYEHDVEYSDGENHRFEILDLSNSVLKNAQDSKDEKEYEDHIRWGDAFMLLFSVVDKTSFDEATRLAFQIHLFHRNSSPKPVVALIATKTDLPEEHRVIFEKEGRSLAESIGARYHEVSTSESYADVERIFRESADLSRFSMVKTPLLMRRASGNGSVSCSSSIHTFRSSGTISCFTEDEDEYEED